MGIGVVSASDPFVMANAGNGTFPAWPKTSNKTMATTSLFSSNRTLILLAIGQSQMANVNPTAFVPTNITKINNFNVLDGANYQATGSLVGCTNYNSTSEFGNPNCRTADTLITSSVADIVWIISPAIGGTAVSEWDTGSCNQRIQVALARLAAHGIPASRIDAVLWGQGETDAANGTTQASYTTSLQSVISNSRTLGITAPWFIAKETYDGTAISTAVQAAQLAVLSSASGIYAGPNADAISTSVANRWDGLHFSDAGAATYSSGWITALSAFGAPFV